VGAAVEVFKWSVVPQATRPGTGVVTTEALHVPVLPKILITTDDGIAGVRGLLISDWITDKDCSALGVIEQLQQEIISSAGSNVYIFAQRVWEDAPELDRFTTESPMFRLVA
jgi:hypothetical protein